MCSLQIVNIIKCFICVNLQVWCWGGFWSLGPDPGLSACKHASSLHPHTTVGHILISSIDLQLYATIGLHPLTKSCRCEWKKGHLDISEIMQIIILKISSNSVLTKLTCSKQCMWASCQESSPLTVVWVTRSTEKNFCLDNFFGFFFEVTMKSRDWSWDWKWIMMTASACFDSEKNDPGDLRYWETYLFNKKKKVLCVSVNERSFVEALIRTICD